MPTSTAAAFQTKQEAGLRHHLDTLRAVLARPAAPTADSTDLLAPFWSLGPLPHPCAGWALQRGELLEFLLHNAGAGRGPQTQLLRDITDNFACLIGRFGFVPNGNRTYYLTRSQPPFFASMVQLLARDCGNAAGCAGTAVYSPKPASCWRNTTC